MFHSQATAGPHDIASKVPSCGLKESPCFRQATKTPCQANRISIWAWVKRERQNGTPGKWHGLQSCSPYPVSGLAWGPDPMGCWPQPNPKLCPEMRERRRPRRAGSKHPLARFKHQPRDSRQEAGPNQAETWCLPLKCSGFEVSLLLV